MSKGFCFACRPVAFTLSFFLLVTFHPVAFAADAGATPAERISLPDGFQVELLYSVPRGEQGSWVSLTHDDQGRLIASSQGGGLYRIQPGKNAEETTVEPLKVDIGQAQGLLYAFDSLYVMVNGNAAQGAGLYRVQDTTGDDQFDSVKLLRRIPGGGEHGPHAVILAPDGKSLYVAAGNHTNVPDPESSLVPRNWQEDQLLPRMWDAGGHAVGKLAPGGWICQTDPDGESFKLVSIGFRNEYDIAFNQDGELFTYDADMEWDIGSPWYRPTRVCHVTGGSEFGWRSGTGKWPSYYPDSLPAAVDIGPGSPTGIVFGTNANFPAKYQQALFIADWSYGLIYAVHLKPHGASYSGEFERFATASPLPVTDMTVNPTDGALYFTIGGRGAQSGLYRVTYRGDEDTQLVLGQNPEGQELRQLRRSLEELLRAGAPDAVEVAWPHLSHEDRFIRYAARVVLEHQPVELWKSKALAELDPVARVTALIALARCDKPTALPEILQALLELDLQDAAEPLRLAHLRAISLALARFGEPASAEHKALLATLDPQYPSGVTNVDRELAQLLIYLEAPQVAARTLDLLKQGKTQEEQIHYALALRTLKQGWTADQRQAYFTWFTKSGGMRGGHSFAGFLRNIRQEASQTLSESEREAFAALLQVDSAEAQATIPPRPHVKKWTVQELQGDVSDLRGRDYIQGKEMFAAAGCYKCHRFAGEGGIIGPDLTGVGRRFTPQYVLEALIEPDKVISDQYQATVFQMENGTTVVGKIANLSGDNVMVITDMLNPGSFTGVNVQQIEAQLPSKVSMMPAGLLDTLHREEILDLIAFLRSGGDSDDAAFAK